MKKPELLSPAGDLLRLKTAIRYGADAVYIGGTSFSLRSRASNLTLADIREACAFARDHGARVHVTANIIPHAEDFEGFGDYIETIAGYGVTAVICSSPAYMQIIRERAPQLEIHCSTQLSCTNAETAVFYRERLGVSRVVLARECTMDDVREIVRRCGMETEAFIHGGMCVSYSGRCVLSNRMTLRDANRGGCAQSCRWQYRMYASGLETGKDTMFTMGSKDLCAAGHIYDLMEAGIDSFKIEGRMKTEHYIATAVSAYRAMIDAIYERQAPLPEEEASYYHGLVLKGENRKTWGGFYDNPDGEDSLIYHAVSNADVRHDFLGTVVQKEKGAIVIETRNPFAAGDHAEILSRNGVHGFVIGQMQNADGETIIVSRHPLARVRIAADVECETGDLVRKTV